MSILKSRTVFPPGGWLFRQPQTGWPADPQKEFNGATFDQVVDKIIAHREANPRFKLPLDREIVEQELEIFTAFRLRSVKGSASYLAVGPAEIPKAPAPLSSLGLAGVAGTVGGAVRKIVAGVGVMADWFGSGLQPVSGAEAQSRADVCTGRGRSDGRCPLNKPTHWTEWAKEAIAARIKSQVEAKAQMELHVEGEAELGTCSACTCVLPLKVWTPLEHIKAHMTEEDAKALDSRCWITKQ